jgi:hypothetical protein
MGRRLQSPRFRKRLLWGSLFVAVTSAVVGGSIVIGNTGRRIDTPVTGGPAWTYREPVVLRMTPALRREFLSRSLAFVQTAVTRKDVDKAYDMAGPSIRQGMSRQEWHTGNIPVVPFPAVGLLEWNVAYSYTDDVALDLALVAPRRSDTVGKTFRIELKRFGKHWLVEAWVPQGISSTNNVRSLHKELASQPEPKAPLGAAWLLAPLGVLGLALLVPVGLGIRSWRVGRRAMREYEATLPRGPETP